jgi:putative ABC transport system substrate-binding protein
VKSDEGPRRRAGRRRTVLGAAVLVSALAFVPPAAVAAGNSVGLIVPKVSGFGKDVKDKFGAFLKAEGVTAEIHALSPATDKTARINSVRKLLAYDMDALVVFGTRAAQDACEETTKVPVVLVAGYDPSGGTGNRPAWMGLNATAVGCKTPMAFLYENMNKTSKLTYVGVLQCTDDFDFQSQIKDIKTMGASRGFDVIVGDAQKQSADQLTRLFAPTQFIHLGWGCNPEMLPFETAKLGKPLVSQSPGFSGHGIVFSLSANPDYMLTEAAKMVARIEKGERPSEITITECQKTDFTVDLQEAMIFDLKIPFEVLQSK